jgi:uncharacterized membrane protein
MKLYLQKITIVAVFLLPVPTMSAYADLRLCNATSSRIGVAIGYKGEDDWITEGWWNIASNTCATVLKGELVARYYYVHGIDYDHGGEWSGKASMCIRDQEFKINGAGNCEKRDLRPAGFFEIDTNASSDWTVKFTDAGAYRKKNRKLGLRTITK